MELFCKEYIIDLNATQAAIRAGYSPKTANEQGSQNLAKVSIQERIEELRREKEEELNISFKDCLERAWKIASEEEKDRSKGLEITIKMMGFYESHNKQKQPPIPPLLWDNEE